MIQGFKELASVCQAIAAGRQTVLLRKAGLRESTSESGFSTPSFYLLPTHYHEKADKVVAPNFQITLRVELVRSGHLLAWSQIEKLLPLTAYDPTTIREHFDSRQEKLLHFALLRPFLLQPTWVLPSSQNLRGCRSWFILPPPPAPTVEAALPPTDSSRLTTQLLS